MRKRFWRGGDPAGKTGTSTSMSALLVPVLILLQMTDSGVLGLPD
jgi:hypothetical protein